MGKKHAEEMDFWTRDEFNTFIKYFEDKPKYYAMFMTLYYTGIQEGELPPGVYGEVVRIRAG